jgi:hypothetical protein
LESKHITYLRTNEDERVGDDREGNGVDDRLGDDGDENDDEGEEGDGNGAQIKILFVSPFRLSNLTNG